MLFIFDMGGVVTSTFQMDAIYKKLNITKDDFFNICKQDDNNIWHDLEIGKIDVQTFWKSFNQIVSKLKQTKPENSSIQNIPEVHSDLFRLFFHPILNEKTVELIKALRKKHRVVCGTNTIQSHWENHLERGDYTFFDQTYASNKIGFAKPDPEFFETILEAENYSPSEAFFTDDKIENCKAAESVGITTLQIVTPQQLYDEWIKYAD